MSAMPENARTEEERSSDLVLLLYLIGKHNEISHLYLGITKAVKYVFLAEKGMLDDQVKGFDHDFFRQKIGPLARSIYSDVNLLREAKLIASRDNLVPTERGLRILKEFHPLLGENRSVTDYVDKVVIQFATSDTADVVEYVYNVDIRYPLGPKKIRDIPKGWELISKLPSEGARQHFEISESWIETMELLLDVEFSERLDEVLEQPTSTQPHLFEGID
jgi:hypothetical protein